MAVNLEELVVQLTAETSSLRAELSTANKATQQAMDRMASAVEKFSAESEKELGFFEQALASAAGFIGGSFVVGAWGKLTDAAHFAYDTIKESIGAVIEEDQALTRLANSLALSGNYTEKAMTDLQNYADEVEATTGTQADFVAQNLAVLSSLTRLDSQGLKQAQQSALDLSAALGIDLSTATSLVAKGINGNTDAFKRYGIEIQKGATDTENFNNVVGTLSRQFGGSAVGAVNNFGGSVTKLQNSYAKFTDELSKSIAQNPVIAASLNEVSKIFLGLASNAEESSIELKQGVANAFLAVTQAAAVTIKMIDLFVRGTEAGIRGLLLPVNALADGIRLIGDALDGSLDNEDPFANTKAQWEDLSKAVEGDSALDTLSQKLAEVYTAGESAFGNIKSSADAVPASIANVTTATRELTEAELAHQEVIKSFAKSLSDSAGAVDAQFKYQSELLKLQKEQDLLTQEEYNSRLQEMQLGQFEVEQAALDEAYANKLISEQMYQDAKVGLQQQQVLAGNKILADQVKYENEQNKLRQENLKSTLGTIATLQDSSSKELAAIGKAAAISQATIDGYAAVQKALAAAPPPFNFALAALVGAATAANVAKIAGVGLASGITEVPRSAGGGNTGDNFPAILKSGERVVDSQTNQDLKAFLANANGNGGRSVTVNLTIAPGTGITREQAGMLVESLNDYFQSGGNGLINA